MRLHPWPRLLEAGCVSQSHAHEAFIVTIVESIRADVVRYYVPSVKRAPRHGSVIAVALRGIIWGAGGGSSGFPNDSCTNLIELEIFEMKQQRQHTRYSDFAYRVNRRPEQRGSRGAIRSSCKAGPHPHSIIPA